MDTSNIIYLFDMIGIIACSVSGTLLARAKNFDLMGCILVAMVNAIGGGTLRDVLLNRHPIFWMVDMNFLVVITVTSLIFQAFFNETERVGRWLKLTDAIGLSAFTLIGLKVALSYGANYPVAILMGIATSIVGGMTRDIICNEIPLVLQREIYITASIVGALLYFLLQHLSVIGWLADIMTMLVVFTIRMLAVYFNWHLPSIRLRH